jgi:hypothetical protein
LGGASKVEMLTLSDKDANVIPRLSGLVLRMDDRDKKPLFGFAQKLTAR